MKLEGLIRRGLVYFLSGKLHLYIVTEYPKSGGTWIGTMLSEILDMAFPRNTMPKLGPCIMHGHYRYFPTINKNRVLVILRDGRDIMVSFYFHSFFKNELFNYNLVHRMRKELPFKDYNDVKNNLPRFIEYKFSKKRPPRFTWSEFIDSWIDINVTFVRYENVLIDPYNELQRALVSLGFSGVDLDRMQSVIEKYSFKNVAKRQPGQENRSSFLRKGVAGDWKNYFNKEARELFDFYAGKQLIRLGYEKDRSWV